MSGSKLISDSIVIVTLAEECLARAIKKRDTIVTIYSKLGLTDANSWQISAAHQSVDIAQKAVDSAKNAYNSAVTVMNLEEDLTEANNELINKAIDNAMQMCR